MTTALGDGAGHSSIRPRLWWVPYLYLLRVQIIVGLILLAAPLALLSPILRGLFDLDYGSPWHSAFGMSLVTLAAFAAAWSLLATTWSTAHNAPARFETFPIEWVRYPITWPERELFGLAAFPTVVAVGVYSWWASRVAPWALLVGALGGGLAAVGLLLVARSLSDWLQRAIHQPHPPRGLPRLLRRFAQIFRAPNVREGFLDDSGTLAEGHVLSWLVCTGSALIYVAIGIGKWIYIGYETYVPTLACVLLLVLMTCWLLVGLAFFLDRYRVSAVGTVLVITLAIGLLPLPGTDHLYETQAHAPDLSPWPHQVLTVGSRTPIVVAATGGGIQAAAWTARVLTGIVQQLPADLRQSYTHSIRLMSTVSGGGVGAMYFAERYSPSGFDDAKLEKVVDKAEASTLDDVAWGATYPDTAAVFFPPIRAVFGDRGQALEWAWTRSLAVASPVSQWRNEVWSDERPANIFNATIVDTGERLLIGTSRVGWTDNVRGLRNFEDVYEKRDLKVVTAVRLAASFTYVSPATRPDAPGRNYHVVDGGYYDDYGMATTTEWLNEALEGTGGAASFPRVLLIQIRSDPGDRQEQPDAWRGPLYQVLAPIEALLHVRITGQASHNDEEFERLQKLWKEQHVEIDNIIFRFCGEHPPLSWHLTGLEKTAIEQEWTRNVMDGRGIRAIEAFLRGRPLDDVDPGKPYDIPLAKCPAPAPSFWRSIQNALTPSGGSTQR
jgi:hypothetical protein